MTEPENVRSGEDRAVQKTLLSSYCPPLIAEARAAQDALLKEMLRGDAYRIADLGCGDGYHGVMFARQAELYHGFEIAPDIAEIARAKLRAAGVDHAEVMEGDALAATLEEDHYDLLFCLYFTPGNFREQLGDLSRYTDEYLDHSPGFIRVISHFLPALRPAGRVFLTVYKDVPEAEASQIDFYEKTGQHVVTERGSRFVATAENFWSVRWTRESMLSNLAGCGIEPVAVVFHDLNEIAWLVEVLKP